MLWEGWAKRQVYTAVSNSSANITSCLHKYMLYGNQPTTDPSAAHYMWWKTKQSVHAISLCSFKGLDWNYHIGVKVQAICVWRCEDSLKSIPIQIHAI